MARRSDWQFRQPTLYYDRSSFKATEAIFINVMHDKKLPPLDDSLPLPPELSLAPAGAHCTGGGFVLSWGELFWDDFTGEVAGEIGFCNGLSGEGG